MKKILTIGIVTYNNNPFSELLFDKLKNELNKNPYLKENVDILVYDDCSTKKDQLCVLEKYKNNFKIYRSKENSGGPSRGRNYIIKNATTKYVLFFDGDDILLGSLEKLIAELKEKSADILVSNVKKVLNDGVIANSPFVLSEKLFNSGINADKYVKYSVHQTGIWSVYSVSFLKENGIKYSRNIRYEDNYFMTKIYLKNPKVDILKSEYYGWRTNFTSFSYNDDSTTHRVLIYKRILKLLSKNKNHQNAPYLLESIWNQTYGNLIRNYPKLKYKEAKKLFNEYEKITKKYSNTIAMIEMDSPEYHVGQYFKFINKFYNSFELLNCFKIAFRFTQLKGLKTKLVVNTFKTFLPMQNKVFLTSHYGDYSDNSKYLYLKMKENPEYKNVKFIFAVKNKALLTNPDFIDYDNKWKYYYHFYTSKAIYFNTWQSPILKKKKKQIFVQLWHGKPYKKIYKDVPTFYKLSNSESIKNKELAIGRWDICYSVDENNTKLFKRLFPNCEIREEMYPKTKWLINNQDNKKLKEKLYKKYNLDSEKKYTLYAPTYRLYETDFDLSAVSKLKNDNNELLVHMHPLSKYEYTNTENIKYMQLIDVEDIQEVILLMDELITDYSSIQYDFEVTGKKIKYYKFDEELYRKVSGIYE